MAIEPRFNPNDGPPPLTGVGAFLTEALGGVTVDQDALKAGLADAQRLPLPRDLFGIGPTEHIQQQLDTILTQIAVLKENGHPPSKSLLRAQAQIEQRLAKAITRDAIMAARKALYPDCWCFGIGGKDKTLGITATDRRGRRITDGEAPATFYAYCTCPEGLRAIAKADQARAELLTRHEERSLIKRRADARLPGWLDDVSSSTHPDQTVVRFASRWYRRLLKPGIVFAGHQQRGKTTLALLLARRALNDGGSVLCWNVPDMLGELTDSFSRDNRRQDAEDLGPRDTHQKLMQRLMTCDFLLLDDLGSEKWSEYVETTLFRILDARTQDGTLLQTIITTNLRSSEVQTYVGTRLYSRLRKGFDRLPFTGPVAGPASVGLTDLVLPDAPTEADLSLVDLDDDPLTDW